MVKPALRLHLNPSATTSFYGAFLSNRWVAVLIACVFFIVAFLILLQQEISFGVWFQLKDLHHETFALASAAVGVGVIIGAAIGNKTQD
jgi:hypothetical protein